MTKRLRWAGLLTAFAVFTLGFDAGAISSRTRLCTQACASCRQPADCPIPALCKRVGVL